MLTFARWKYVVILLVLLVSIVYALPNAFPQDPSVQVTAAREGTVAIDDALAKRIVALLQKANIPAKSVAVEAKGNLLVRLADANTQTRASDTLRPELGSDYVVALSLAPTAPEWLGWFGARPMPRGLDLQGGVHFAMQVNEQAAIEKRLDAYQEDIRSQFRTDRIVYSSVARTGPQTLSVTLRNAADSEKAVAKLQTIFPNYIVAAADNGRITVNIPDAGIQLIATEAIEQNLTTLRNRINSLGVAEPVIQRQGTNRVVIQLPGLQDTAEAKRQIGATATLEFRAVVGDEQQAMDAVQSKQVPPNARIYYQQNGAPLLLSKRLLVSGDQLVGAVAGVDPDRGGPSVSITLDSIGGQRMLDHTLENVGQRLGIVYVENIPETKLVDGKEVRSVRTEERVISASTIQGVFGKNFQTTGLSQQEASDLATQLKSGALAAPMSFVEERVVGPSLGAENVARGTRAVLYSFLFALGFFLLYYRMFGIITCLALVLNLLMVVAVMSVFGATMSLPGFAGLALTVGMSVDANVLINERIREELRAGMPPQAAIATGYDRASGTIFDSNMTAVLAGLALLLFGTGPLKGFALTMIIGIATSVFTAVPVSRGLATLVYGGRRKLKSIAI
ncbi:Protein-export membrane protein SecD [Lysobacter dokdonensis DS-58]|uniref:Protein translocase subunit SecD n=1 Tax=Lysobacter dokdonensis DS-58 TaxID=1300345 RepID=A0A0A2WZW5_9GAMM|nr:protein translocase subunit SecD [Lysobacter dokdonensis]KGQ18529.1 Protein-export membrane protein SecD [Lysobacter dokdonensis DS-58]